VNRSLVLGLLLVAAVAAGGIAVWAGGDGHGAEPSRVPTDSAVRVDLPLPLRAGRIVGYVRDVNGRPVPGATVRLKAGRRRARANRSGRFVLRAGAGRRTVVAAHPAYTRQSVAATLRRGQGARVDFSLAVTAPDRVSVPNSADRLIVWTSCDELAGLSEPELQSWIGRGVDGFVCQTQHLPGLGGDQVFTGDSRAQLDGPDTRLQRALRASPAVFRARQGKLLLYLGFYTVNYFNESTPLVDWFDDRGWSQDVLPRVRDLAGAARSMGFAGLAVDHELYPQEGGGQTASWSTRYPGSGHSEAQVRAAVKQRGRELMKNMVRAYPGLELVAYDMQLPESWSEKVQAEINQLPDVFASDVRIDLWDGLSSVEGYSAIRWLDATFYKTPHLGSWDAALEYNANRIYSYLSRRFSNWSYASSRLHLAPFSWVTAGTTEFEQARDPDYVAEQLEAFNRWGAGGTFANYAYSGLGGSDYGPYEDALRAASSPSRVDRRPPKLLISSPAGRSPRVPAGERISLRGVASDDFAIRAVRWYDDRGREGVARLTWNFKGDYRSGWNGEMSWSIDNLVIPQHARRLTISAEDIHGLASQMKLTVSR
jgi:hypothetical protein